MSTNSTPKRRNATAARDQALEAARALLLDGGPSAVTLKAVGARMGVGHANLIHHFGSAAGLQGALMDRMMRDLAADVAAGLTAAAAAGDRRALIDAAFEAFGAGGASQLAAWLVLARETDRAQSFAQVVRDLADQIAERAGGDDKARAAARASVATTAYMAFADGLIGEVLCDLLDLPRERMRQTTLEMSVGQILGESPE